MIVGMMRFNFTLTTDIKPQDLMEAVIKHVSHIPGFDVAYNTIAVNYDIPGKIENPPMPSFDKVKGIVRER